MQPGSSSKSTHFYEWEASADPEGGGERGSGPPPLRFVRGGVLCSGLMGGRGGPTVVFDLLLSIFLSVL